jgi:methanogenic corrinoid protein MtbC1
MEANFPQQDRQRLADKLKNSESSIIEETTAAFFLSHPETRNYSKAEKGHCATDAGYHLSFLRNAIEFGNQETFARYRRWTTNMLQSRNLPHRHIQEFFVHMAQAMTRHLSGPELQLVQAFLHVPSPDSLPSEEPLGTGSPSPLRHCQDLFLQALLAGERHAARTVAVEALSQGHSLLDIYVEIFQESLYQIGRLWENNHLSVAQEHVATAITQYVMANMYSCLQPQEAYKGKGIVTGVEGELHQVGAHMVADVLELHGWDIRFLGVHLPQNAIMQMIKDFQPDLIGISVTMIVNVPSVRALIKDIRNHLPMASTRILVGGSAFRMLPDAHREIGADGFAGDLRSLISLLSE